MEVKDTSEEFEGEHIILSTIKNLMSLGYAVCYYDNNKHRLDHFSLIFMYKTKNTFFAAPISITDHSQIQYDVAIFVNPSHNDLNVKNLKTATKFNIDLFIPEE